MCRFKERFLMYLFATLLSWVLAFAVGLIDGYQLRWIPVVVKDKKYPLYKKVLLILMSVSRLSTMFYITFQCGGMTYWSIPILLIFMYEGYWRAIEDGY